MQNILMWFSKRILSVSFLLQKIREKKRIDLLEHVNSIKHNDSWPINYGKYKNKIALSKKWLVLHHKRGGYAKKKLVQSCYLPKTRLGF